MRPRGWLAVGVLALIATVLTPTANALGASPDGVLTLSIPGPFRGCGYFATGTNEPLRALLDLVRPSAFLTSETGVLQGENGPITSAALISLSPLTVTYTVQPGWLWSNGKGFTIADLIAWDHQAVHQDTSLADGYRDIASLTPSLNDTQMTAVFSQPYADWDNLFRDVNERGTAATCTLSQLAGQPSLGPYTLRSITPTRAVLTRNASWLGTPAVFNTLVVATTLTSPTTPGESVVDYEYTPSALELSSLAAAPDLDGEVGLSDQLMVVGFSPHRAATNSLAIRQFLSLAINRQAIIDDVAGPVSYDPGLADSVLYPQGQTPYAGVAGLSPFAQSTALSNTILPTTTDMDCVTCAASRLRADGFQRHGTVWESPSGSPLEITVAVGPSRVDSAVANMVTAQWSAAGVVVSRSRLTSNVAVTAALRAGRADAGVFTVTTSTAPDLAARSWTGVDEGNTYDLGWRSLQINQWFAVAQDTYNPVAAETPYASIDQYIAAQAWERPLYTQPTVLVWSSDLAAVDAASSLTGLVDEAPTWGVVPINAQSG